MLGTRLAASIVLGGLAFGGSAASAHGRGPAKYYGSPRITYFDRSGFGAAVDEAAREWNAIGSPIRLTRVASAARAKIVVSSVARLPRSRDGEIAGRGGPGVVILSRRALNDDGLVRQADIAAHEFGHALGLRHSRPACDVMYYASQTWGCRSRGARYRCGPGPGDVRQLARIWGWRAKITAHTGYCAFRPPDAELTPDDVPDLTLPLDFRTQRTLRFFVRNTSGERWFDELLAVATDADGRYLDTGCLDDDGPFVATEMVDSPIQPGQVAAFDVYVCGQPGQTKTFHFRLASKWFRPRPFVFGPRWDVTVQFQAGTFGPPGLRPPP
jgi:hypothetical protein